MMKWKIVKTSDVVTVDLGDGHTAKLRPLTPRELRSAEIAAGPVEPYAYSCFSKLFELFHIEGNEDEPISSLLTREEIEVYKFKNQPNTKALGLRIKDSNGAGILKTLRKILPSMEYKPFDSKWLLLSVEDRMELLRGLIDSDGNISPQGRVEFYNTSEKLTQGFFEIAASLGFKPSKRVRKVEGLNIVNHLKDGQSIKSKTFPIVTVEKQRADSSFAPWWNICLT